jgi:hypothetical protein
MSSNKISLRQAQATRAMLESNNQRQDKPKWRFNDYLRLVSYQRWRIETLTCSRRQVRRASFGSRHDGIGTSNASQ